jgi:hypothetical protein
MVNFATEVTRDVRKLLIWRVSFVNHRSGQAFIPGMVTSRRRQETRHAAL